MLISKTVMLKWNPKIKKHYVAKGYHFTSFGDNFEVKVEDLTIGSHVEIELLCDYCKEPFKRKYKLYLNSNKNGTVLKDSCRKCVSKKRRDFYLINYGVENNSQLEDHRESKKKDINFIKTELANRGYKLLSTDYVYCTEKLIFICNKHEYKGVQELSWTQFNRGFGCRYCGYEKVSESMKGSNNQNWKGGITPITFALREFVIPWKIDSLKKYNRTCVLSGVNDGTLEVHHLNKNFSNIVDETFEELKLTVYDDMSKYNQEERELIRDKLLELHYYYGMGIPLTKELHRYFHLIYGKINNTPKQFEEFKIHYINNKLNELESKVKEVVI